MMEDDDFLSDEEHALLNSMERSVHTDESEEEAALRIFKENLPNAARTIVGLGLKGQSERVRYDASKYVVERIMGGIPSGMSPGSNDMFQDLMEAILTEDDGEKVQDGKAQG